ncbi:MAG: response regulator [Candidatus Binatia bacterium]
MARVLTVDDSRAVRSIVVRQLNEWGVETDEAEDGIKGLEKLDEVLYDLVLLDVTMPEMDGPTMLARMREAGNKTPVLMLTSEAKRSIVGEVMKLGIDDYILKPFKPEELKAKVSKVLKDLGGAGATPVSAAAAIGTAAAAPTANEVPTEPGARRFVDVFLVDDMDNVHKRLRGLLPENISMDACSSAQDALNRVRERVYRLVIVDNQIPDVNSVALMNQMRALQPRATMINLCLRTADNALEEAKKEGYDGVLFKPLTQDLVDELVASYFDTSEILTLEGSSMRVSAYTGREEGLDRYYTKLTQRVHTDMLKIAEACFDNVELDAVKMPLRPERAIKLMVELASEAGRLGLDVKLRGTPDLGSLLSNLAETAKIPFEVVG